MTCNLCAEPRYKGLLCHEHYKARKNELQNAAREGKKTNRCKCGAAIGPTSRKCRKCNLGTINNGNLTLTPPPLVFAGLREDLAADEALYCPYREKVVDAVRRRA